MDRDTSQRRGTAATVHDMHPRRGNNSLAGYPLVYDPVGLSDRALHLARDLCFVCAHTPDPERSLQLAIDLKRWSKMMAHGG